MDPELQSVSRKAWGDLETLHVVGYFAPEVTEEYVDLGLHPQLAYFPGRAAAFGEAGPGLTVATFYVFAPWLVEAALPAAWQTTTPEKVVAARRTGMSRALGKTLGTPDVSEALAIARDVCAALSPQGRPLFAAHAELPWPEDDVLALWHAATLVREHRGDGHVSVLQTRGLDPVEATVLGGLWSGRPASSARPGAGPTGSGTRPPTGSVSGAGSTPMASSPTWAAPSVRDSRTTPTGSRSRAGPRSARSGRPACTSWWLPCDARSRRPTSCRGRWAADAARTGLEKMPWAGSRDVSEPPPGSATRGVVRDDARRAPAARSGPHRRGPGRRRG